METSLCFLVRIWSSYAFQEPLPGLRLSAVFEKTTFNALWSSRPSEKPAVRVGSTLPYISESLRYELLTLLGPLAAPQVTHDVRRERSKGRFFCLRRCFFQPCTERTTVRAG